MSAHRGPGGEIAGIARQARDLLVRVNESRWPGFDLPPAARQPATGRRILPEGEPAAGSSLEQIAQAVNACTKCPLHTTRTRAVPGEGNPQARLMFVGEAPGEDEDRQGRPFVGAAGKLLDQMIGPRAMGLSREKVFIANVLKCRPPGNRDPLEHEIAACLPYLHAQIALIRPEIICTLGRYATQALLARRDSLGKMRGRFHEYLGTPLVPTFHPSYLLRTPGDKKLAWEDLQLIMRRLGLPPSDPSRTKEKET